jgi:16S rRNA (guanine1207-N2)-methyltransferase
MATLEHPTGEVEQTSYPGLFAKGRLDPATALLLETIRTPEPGTMVLDFACGAGVIGNNLLSREPAIQLHLLDSDAVAVAATQENVPQGEVHTGASLTQLPDNLRFDLIVSNPPIHDGKARDYAVVRDLIKNARSRLNRGGALWLVVQRQVPVGNLLEERLAKTRAIHEDGQFKVWRAIAP